MSWICRNCEHSNDEICIVCGEKKPENNSPKKPAGDIKPLTKVETKIIVKTNPTFIILFLLVTVALITVGLLFYKLQTKYNELNATNLEQNNSLAKKDIVIRCITDSFSVSQNQFHKSNRKLVGTIDSLKSVISNTSVRRIVWDNGDEYTGYMSNNQPNGSGTMRYHDGYIFYGIWANGAKYLGKLTYPGEDIFQVGEWRNDYQSNNYFFNGIWHDRYNRLKYIQVNGKKR